MKEYRHQHHRLFEDRLATRFADAILMPKEMFLKQYNIAMMELRSKRGVIIYLSRFFEVPQEAVERRIVEVVFEEGKHGC